MADVTYRVSWGAIPGSFGYLVEYRQDGTDEWITPIDPPNPSLAVEYVLTLDSTLSYDVRVSSIGNNCASMFAYIRIENEVTYIWVANTITCEQDESFILAATYSGFSSPTNSFYDDTSGRVYIGDNDDVNGNAYWFNPSGFTGFGSINYVAGLTDTIYAFANDAAHRRMYFIGLNTGGLKTLNIATNTFSTTAYGTNGVDFSRTFIYVASSVIYTSDNTLNELYLINRTTLALSSTIAIGSIPSGLAFIDDGFQFSEVNGNIWVSANFRTTGSIGVYNTSFTTLIDTINLPGIAHESSGRYRQSAVYDQAHDRFYISDAGSSQLFIINGTTRTIIDTIQLKNTQGKLFVLVGFTFNPINNDLYLPSQAYDTVGDVTTKYILYKIDRSNGNFINIAPNQTISSFSHQTSTNVLWTQAPFLTSWEDVGTTWKTDGKIYKYTV